ncbi:MAG: hypothetical protein HFH32_09435 [Eubacterium sp.]|nr:hypothetical protein [Eubacterium sp.]
MCQTQKNKSRQRPYRNRKLCLCRNQLGGKTVSFWRDFGEKLEVLSFLPKNQDFGTGMSPKGARQPWMAYRAPVRAVPDTLEQRA